MWRRLAVVTEAFKAKIARLKHTQVYQTPAFKGGKKNLTVFDIRDPQDKDDPGYFYVQRFGTDSVALVFYDPEGDADKPWIVLEQYNSPVKKLVRGAFTGSLDKPTLDATEIAIEEAQEEAGYTVTKEQVIEIGYTPVSANTNECVHLFVIDVTGEKPNKAEPENIFEANTNIVRCSIEEVFSTCEWKAQLCVMHYLAQSTED